MLALGRALHYELVALTGGHIAGQTTSLPEGWVKTTSFGGYFLGIACFRTLSRSTFRLHHLDKLMPDGQQHVQCSIVSQLSSHVQKLSRMTGGCPA